VVTKLPGTTNSKRRKIYFGTWYQRLQSMVGQLSCFGTVVGQNIMMGSLWWRQSAHFMAPKKWKERDRKGLES
jgi:hypothetical protein